jgi:tRNA A-37 threonylcarbamoyl transferase component Bud32
MSHQPTITYRSVVTQTPDGSAVVKRVAGEERLPLLPSRWESFTNERRIGRLLAETPPPVPVPRLLASDPHAGVLVFEAIAAEPLGPKRPTQLASANLDRALAVADAVAGFDPPRNGLYRLPIRAHLDHHRRHGRLSNAEAQHLGRLDEIGLIRWSFAHGDLSPRNILKRPDGSVAVIDWERAGLHPAGYDHAFLWYTTAVVPGARSRIKTAVPHADEASFLLSALLITLIHLDRPAPGAARGDSDRDVTRTLVNQLMLTAG